MRTILTHIQSPTRLTSREAVLGLALCASGAVACLMTGMVIGMLISPRKTVSIGSHNGGNVHYPNPTPEENPSCEQS